MKGIIFALVFSVNIPICIGRNVQALHAYDYVHKPGLSSRELKLADEGRPSETTQLPVVCEDDPNYADGCPRKAAVTNYCTEQEEFMRRHCAKSCKFCSEASTAQPTTEAIKPPAPAATTGHTEKPLKPGEVGCADNPKFKDPCADIASTPGLCQEQEDFTRKNCKSSCGWCGRESEKPTSPVVCEDDPNYADGCPLKAAVTNYCRDQEEFMRRHCAKSCKFCKGASTAQPTTEAIKPPAPVVCEDDPNYADRCPEKAAVINYCNDQKKFMRKHCAKSCNFCGEASTTRPTEKPLKPGEIGCADNPQFKDQCADIALTPGLCQEQEDFTRKNCKSSCGWCGSPATKPPIQEICDEDAPKWRHKCPIWAAMGECEIRKKFRFYEHYCPKSCKFPCKKEPTVNPNATKPPSPPAFCRDRDRNCEWWKSFGMCENHGRNSSMAVYCGVTCGFCKAPTPEECYDKGNNCQELKNAGLCSSTRPDMEYEVKTNCLQTCEFCVPNGGP
nr:proprotein convertase subtilisin/kexin type 5-like isoform X1 [Pocillopora verrucosa]